MKNTILSFILVLSIIPSIAFASIDQNLKYGMKSNEVVELQEFLIDKGLLNSTATGYFGVLTLKAVKQYQLSVKVPNTGYVGVITRAEINKDLEELLSDSTKAEIAEVGTSTVATSSQPVQSPVTPVTPTPVSTPTPVVTYNAPIMETPTIEGPIYTCNKTMNPEPTLLVTFKVSEPTKKIEIMASSSNAVSNGQSIYSTANNSVANGETEISTYFQREVADYNYTITAYFKGKEPVTKTGTYSVNTYEQCK